MVDPHDESADLTSRVRAYLHTNCAHCHRFGGGGTADFSLPYNTTLEESKTIGVRPSQGTFGIAGARIIAPGDPYRSVMLYRMAKLGRGHMPHIGSTFIDEWGVDLIFQWISSLPENSGEPEPSLSFAPIRAKQHEVIERLRSCADPSGDGQAAAVDQLLSDTSGALMLLRGIDDGKFGMALRRAILDQALAVPNPLIRELFERFVPVEQRTKTLGTVVNAADILSHPGDAGRGAKIFFETEGIQCKSCHRIRGNGTELGPDLSEIGKKYNRAQLLETILEPSKAVDAKYLTYVLETKSGKLYSGLLAEKSDQAVVLKTTENKPIRVTSDDVELLVTQQKSLMPELLLRDMTIQDVADLLEYLASLKD
jgi:putative heme-binding domain-containing protein